MQGVVVGRLGHFGVGNYTVSALAPLRLALRNFYCAPAKMWDEMKLKNKTRLYKLCVVLPYDSAISTYENTPSERIASQRLALSNFYCAPAKMWDEIKLF